MTNSIPNPLSSLEVGSGWEYVCQNSNPLITHLFGSSGTKSSSSPHPKAIQGPFKSHLIRNKESYLISMSVSIFEKDLL